jgi:Ran GTPase-activating protein (RanGAP) involved in mRNA processing and transport
MPYTMQPIDKSQCDEQFTKLPLSEKELILDLSRLAADLSRDELIVILKKIPQNITHLTLQAKTVSVAPLLALSELPEHITTLNLNSNNLGERSGDELVQLFAHLARHIKQLKLGDNNLHNIAEDKLAQAFQELPLLSHLYLWGNKLGEDSLEDVERQVKYNDSLRPINVEREVFAVEPYFAYKTISMPIRSMSKSIKYLDLSFNNLGNRSGAELKQLLQAIVLTDLKFKSF